MKLNIYKVEPDALYYKNDFERKIITNILCICFIFQLSFFGLLPEYLKVVGDSLLIILLLSIHKFPLKLFSKSNIYKFSDSKFFKIAVIFSNIFLFYVFFQIIYSYILWGDLFLVLRQARRWIIAGIYFRLLLSDFIYKVNPSLLKIWFRIFIILAVLSVILNKMGFILPSGGYSFDIQGGDQVLKPFIPGTLFLYFSLLFIINNYFNKLKNNRIIWILIFFPYLLIVLTLVPFRGWAIGTFLATAIIIFLYNKKNLFYLMVPIIIVVLLINTNNYNTKVDWVSSAFSDFENNTGNYNTRYINDILKIYYLNSNNLLVNGIGFLHKESYAGKHLHISNETNDTGWVEVFLTGGILGSTIFIFFYLFNLINYIALFKNVKNNLIALAISLWVMSGITMISSNFLLWDFGFVPLFFCLLYILSQNAYMESLPSR